MTPFRLSHSFKIMKMRKVKERKAKIIFFFLIIIIIIVCPVVLFGWPQLINN